MTTLSQAPNLGQQRNTRGQFIARPHAPTLKQIIMQAEALGVAYGIRRKRIVDHYGIKPVRNLPTAQEYADLLRIVERYNYCVDREIDTAIFKQGAVAYRKLQELYQKTSNASNVSCNYIKLEGVNIRRLQRDLIKPPPSPSGNSQITLQKLVDELISICKAHECIWDTEKKLIKIVTGDVIVKHPTDLGREYNFGRFFIELPLTKSYPKLVAHTPRFAPGRGMDQSPGQRVTHPTIRGESLCFGNGAIAAERALFGGRLFDVVELIMSILPTYSTSPYQPIERWNGICDRRVDPSTGEQVAIDATVSIPPSQMHRCPTCAAEVTRLVSCYNSSCSLHNVCVGCVSNCAWEGCNNHVCEDHEHYCPSCEDSFCDQHFGRDDDGEICDRCMENDE